MKPNTVSLSSSTGAHPDFGRPQVVPWRICHSVIILVSLQEVLKEPSVFLKHFTCVLDSNV